MFRKRFTILALPQPFELFVYVFSILEKLLLKLLFSFSALVLSRSYFIDAMPMFCAHPKHS